MLYQIIIVAGLLILLLNLILNLRSIRKPSRNSKLPASPPLISVLIPARDEENNIGACLESLRLQDYPNFEVLVLDDNSQDGTATVISKLAAKDSRIKLLNGSPLPDDWAGKPFACYQLAKQASGDWLLFVDADTVHDPGMLRSVMATALTMKVSLLSGFPRQLTDSLPQKMTVPLIYFFIMSWAPLWWIHRSKAMRPSVAIGQFLLFSRDEYWRIGGHKVVQSRILEDIWMGIEVSRHGGRHVAIDLSSQVSCNMYPTAGAMWRGLVRCIYSVSALSPVLLLFLVPVAWLFYMGPFFWLWNGFFVANTSVIWRGMVVLQVAIIIFMRWLIDRRFKESPISAWLHPIGISHIFIMAVYAFLRWLTGAGVTWKERVYGEEESVVK
jgi:chlorobactene glucosyltransferase